MALEELHGALVPLSCGASCECSEVAALAGPRIQFARIETVLTVTQLPDHDGDDVEHSGSRTARSDLQPVTDSYLDIEREIGGYPGRPEHRASVY